MLAFRQLFLFVPVITVSGNLGASECPCITNASARYADYVATVAATSGLPTTYGLTGCAAHDANVALFGCSQNQGAYCSNPWCFVDPDLCPEDESLCDFLNQWENFELSWLPYVVLVKKTELLTPPQGAQYPLIEEHTSNHSRNR